MKRLSTVVLACVSALAVLAGVVLAGQYVYERWVTGISARAYTDSESSRVEASWGALNESSEQDGSATEASVRVEDRSDLRYGQTFGLLSIPSIGINKLPIQVGASREILDRGVASWIEESSVPGEPGRVALAAHRQGYGEPFNKLPELKPGELIRVRTEHAEFTYEVVRSGQVHFEDSDIVVGKAPGNSLVLVSCTTIPGSQDRVFVVAHQVSAVSARARNIG